jgi:hypothetical protein
MFRVILPPYWAQPLGGRDLFTWQDAEKVVLQACYNCPIDPDEDAVKAKTSMDFFNIRLTHNRADAASHASYMCHKRVLEYLQRTTPYR